MPNEYFSHDYNSRNDRKMVAFLKKHKAQGLGVYWTTIEMLHEEGGYMQLDTITFTSIGAPIGCNADFVKKVINDCINEFKLMKKIEDKFTADRVLKNLTKRKEIREIRSKAGKASAVAKQQNSTHVEQVLTHVEQMPTSVQQNSTKERKGKERKRKRESHDTHDLSKSNLYRESKIPTLEQVREVFYRHGGTDEMANKFFETNAATEWFYRGSPIRNFSTMVPGYIQSWRKNQPSVSAQANLYEQQLAEARQKFKPTQE
jgi:hypothetical protein